MVGSSAQPALFDPRPVHPFVAEQAAVLDDQAATSVDVVTAALRLCGHAYGPGGDPHMMGHRAGPYAELLVAALEHHGWAIVRAGPSAG